MNILLVRIIAQLHSHAYQQFDPKKAVSTSSRRLGRTRGPESWLIELRGGPMENADLEEKLYVFSPPQQMRLQTIIYLSYALERSHGSNFSNNN